MGKVIRSFADEVIHRQEQEALQRPENPEAAAARAFEAKLRNEAISVAQTMSTPGWTHVDTLLRAALSEITERALLPAKSVDKATVRLLQAQGAVEVINKFRAALELARKENNASKNV